MEVLCLNCNSKFFEADSLNHHNHETSAKPILNAFKNILVLQSIYPEDIGKLHLCQSCNESLNQYCKSKQIFLKYTKHNSKISNLLRTEPADFLSNEKQGLPALEIEDQEITSDLNIEDAVVPDNESLDECLQSEGNVDIVEYKELFIKLEVEKLSESESTAVKLATRKDLTQESENFLTASNFECVKCLRLFSEQQQLTNHVNSVHCPIERSLKCNLCSQTFSMTWFLENHLKVCHNGIQITHFCKICLNKFYNKKELDDHILKKHDIRKYPFKCRNCLDSFKVISDLRDHLLDEHKGTKEATIAENNIKTNTARKLKNVTCSICKKVFQEVNALRKHERCAHQYGAFNCNICKQEFKSFAALRKHQSKHKTCLICDKVFGTYQRLKLHHQSIHVVSENFPYACEMCGQKYSEFGPLRTHYRWHVEVNGPKHCCNICNKTYKLRQHLVQHVKQAHSGKHEKHKCPFCELVFKAKVNLSTHVIENHQPDLKYPCRICGKKFLNQFGLRAHKRKHIQETNFSGEKMKRTKFEKVKRVNSEKEKITKPVKAIIGKVEMMSCYSSETYLFTCPSCGKSSESHSHFVRHLRTLHGLKGYADPNIKVSTTLTCQICDKKFDRKDNLDRHRRRAHNLTKRNNIPSVAVLPRSFDCPHCKKTITNCCRYETFMAHVMRHETFIVENIKDNPTSKKELTEFYDEEKKRYTCSVCKDHYRGQAAFLHHLTKKPHSMTKIIHDLEKASQGQFTYKCDECPGVTYPTMELLRRHKEGHRRYKRNSMQTCTICRAIFKSPEYLEKHLKTHA